MTKLADEFAGWIAGGSSWGISIPKHLAVRILSALKAQEAAVTETHAAEGDVERLRKPRSGKGWPPITSDEIEARIDRLCGCKGRWDCDCVGTFNRACGDAWYDYNYPSALRNTRETDRG